MEASAGLSPELLIAGSKASSLNENARSHILQYRLGLPSRFAGIVAFGSTGWTTCRRRAALVPFDENETSRHLISTNLDCSPRDGRLHVSSETRFARTTPLFCP